MDKKGGFSPLRSTMASLAQHGAFQAFLSLFTQEDGVPSAS